MTLVFTRRLSGVPQKNPQYVLSLTADERSRSRYLCQSDDGHPVYLNLPRGTTLRHGDCLQSEAGELAQVYAKAEPVLTVTAQTPLELLQAAYHLGNRHVPLEIADSFLKLSPDPVLQDLLAHRGLHIVAETVPFQPETGAYGHQH